MPTDDSIPKRIARVFPNQKLWVDKSIHNMLNACTTTYHARLQMGDMTEYKVASYRLGWIVKNAK